MFLSLEGSVRIWNYFYSLSTGAVIRYLTNTGIFNLYNLLKIWGIF